jgi:hypothetical protein
MRILWALILGAAISRATYGTGSTPVAPGSIQDDPKPAPRTPPPTTSFPKSYLDMIALLLRNGFADPRGGQPVVATISPTGVLREMACPWEVVAWLMPSET